MKLPYVEGTLFAFPLSPDGWAVGVVARMRKRGGSLFGYFFGPRRKEVPTLNDMGNLKAPDAILKAKFGDLHLIDGRWPVIGRVPNWDRALWPMPLFFHEESFTGRKTLVQYDEDNPRRSLRSFPFTGDASQFGVGGGYETAGTARFPFTGNPNHFADDSLLGAGAVEIVVSKLLRPEDKAE